MYRPVAIIIFLVIAIHFVHGQNNNNVVIGTKHTIYSDTLSEDRGYWVSLPESYDVDNMSYKRYPILILLDGHAHLKSVSGMVNYMSSGYNGNRRIPEMIIVAIQNVNRRRDFTPDKIITKRQNDSGGGERFLSFLENELIPEIDRAYRTTPYRILYGHSLGGLLASHAYMKAQTMFNSFIAVDPSMGTWDADTMDDKVNAVTDRSFERYLYIATANWGKRNIRNGDRQLRLYESLNRKCVGPFPAKLEYFEDENHGSIPVIAFHNGITAIFDGYGISYRDVSDMAQLNNHYKSISQRLSYDFAPPEALVNRVAYGLLRGSEEDKSNAIEFFTLNTENYPGSFNAFNSLGEAYEAIGDHINAIKHYQKSAELNPDNIHAIGKIESLKKD